jgi:TolB-like protein/Tfp pilus assembly protein PilF
VTLLSELKRRNVIRVGAAYFVSSWLLIELADIMFEAFGFPPAAMKWLIGALGLGILPMLIFSWVYELTPEGLVKDAGPGHENPENRRTGRRLDQVTIAMILFALVVVAIERFVVPQRVLPPPEVVEVPSGVVETRQLVVNVPALPIPEGPSIAVLPFTNMSPDPDNAYFADGISEEILNVLADVDGLKVASRTSAFNFRDTDTSIPDIARQLGVAHVLEGSVRKAGMRVRITAQLIDAETDQHLWSDTYDRDLTDIFAVQEEIAQAITAALGDALGLTTIDQIQVAAPTQDLAAYELFLQGRTLFYQRGLALRTAREQLEAAVERDPDFAEAWAMLAATYAVMGGYVPDLDQAELNPMATAAAERAIALDDALGLPHAVLGLVAQDQPDMSSARQQFGAALTRDPDNAMIRLWAGINLLSVGHLSEALEQLRIAQNTDPLIGVSNFWLGVVLNALGRSEEGMDFLVRSRELDFTVADIGIAIALASAGDREAAAEHLTRFLSYDPTRDPSEIEQDAARVAAVRDPGLVDPERDALVFAVLGGRVAEAIAAVDGSDGGWSAVATTSMWYPAMRPAREHPDFFSAMGANGYVAYWEAFGYPDGCTRTEGPDGDHLACAESAR